ncbi:MAG TPA: TonB-dependent receptor [Arachidicoccus sp.]|nr:TonB-dependent receptor [Arachidicoccus sp.]
MKKVFYLLFLLCGLPSYIFAQPITISGRVTDSASGSPIVRASIELRSAEGKVTGTLTNSDGQYKISTDAAPATIMFSYIGMTTVTQDINNRSEINAVLSANNSTLNDVVVVGFGTQTKATLTGAVSEISGKELVTTKNENVVNMLSGKIPGVRITQTSSRPGAFESNIDIRGMGAPLIVVDGIPRDAGYFSHMNPENIASVSVLKDASAAVYGLHSANGVILVTTKIGTNSGRYDIEYSVNRGWQQFLHVPHNVDALQYMTLANEKNRHNFATDYMNYGDPSHLLFNDQDFAPFLNGSRQTTDWYDAVFVKTAPQVQHNITVNGGTDKLRFYFNLGYMNQESSLRSGDMNYHKWNFRSNIDANITKRLHATVSIDGYMDQVYQPNTDIWAIYKDVWIERPDVLIYANNDPSRLNSYLIKSDNPLAMTNADMTGYSKYINREFNGRVSLSYDIPKIEGLTAKAMYNYHFHESDNADYHKAFNLYNYDSTTGAYATSVRHAVNGISSIQRAYYPSYSDLMQLSLSYKHTFLSDHHVEALALFEDAYGYNDNFYASRELSLNSEYLFAGNAANQVGNMDKNGLFDNASQALVGKLNYNYKGKYLVDFGFRYDGSSKFPSGSRWGFFPSVSAGWRISEESFVKKAVPQLTNLKFRVSYGKTGDDGSAGNYPATIVGYEIRPNDLGYIFNGSLVNGVAPTAIPNPDLTWFTAKMFNIGLDFELWHGLVGGSFDWFNRHRDGLLATASTVIPGTVGASLPQQNLNSDITYGYEAIVTHRNSIGKLSYNITAQMSATKTRNGFLLESPAGNSYDQWRNRSSNRNTGIWWGKDYLGQFKSYDQIYNYPVAVGAGGTVPGDYYYQDWNGDGIIDGNDDHPIASYGLPLFNYGLTLGAAWENIDLSLTFQGASQVYYRYTETLAEPLSFGDAGTMTQFWDRWHPQDPNADIYDPSTVWVPGYYASTGSALADGTRAIQDASYLRLKTIEVGYSLPEVLLKNIGIKEFRIYLSGYNLLTFTGLHDMDPEHPGGEGGAVGNSVDTYKYPINKTYNIGASIKF